MWIVNVRAQLSPTEIRVRTKFKTNDGAISYRRNLVATVEPDNLTKRDEQLLRIASLFRGGVFSYMTMNDLLVPE